MKFEHANITVRNIDTSSAFYRTLFDFEERWRGTGSGEQGSPVRAVHVGNEDLYLSFFEAERSGDGKSDYSAPGINHIGFEVTDLQPYRDRLKQLGVEIHFEPNYEPGKRIYFYDPDGVEIELVCY